MGGGGGKEGQEGLKIFLKSEPWKIKLMGILFWHEIFAKNRLENCKLKVWK